MPEFEKFLPPEPPSESETGRHRKLTMGIPRKDADPTRLHRWRTFLGLSVYALILLMSVVMTAMIWGLPLVGQVAWASDQDRKTDEKIAKAVNPIAQKVEELSRKVDAQNDISNAFLAKVAEDSLVDTFAKMCKAEPFSDDWRKLNSDYQRYRDNYFLATKRPYRDLSCSDLNVRRAGR